MSQVVSTTLSDYTAEKLKKLAQSLGNNNQLGSDHTLKYRRGCQSDRLLPGFWSGAGKGAIATV